eukprot:TRINITY_DN23531_c0_g1_i2.p1 TRINITY_DN23531_c0_g1~~TRINITY_DN23531_c0_g1_i2.p1  ORF type:complete len:227 (-),score=32.50 TRINITY_DN23531_c0_g1_i2:55-735(-)
MREAPGDGKTSFELWIVQEWCGLGTLTDFALKGTVFKDSTNGSWNCVAQIGCEIASAASYLHSRRIIHGDLSANNVLLTVSCCPKGYIAKVTDFGMSRILGDSQAIETKSMGAVASMPPELFSLADGKALVTPKVDVYAFGIVFWMLCNSSLPHEGLTFFQIVAKSSNRKSNEPALEMKASVPEPFCKVFLQTTEKDPENRPPFVEVVHNLLSTTKMSFFVRNPSV